MHVQISPTLLQKYREHLLDYSSSWVRGPRKHPRTGADDPGFSEEQQEDWADSRLAEFKEYAEKTIKEVATLLSSVQADTAVKVFVDFTWGRDPYDRTRLDLFSDEGNIRGTAYVSIDKHFTTSSPSFAYFGGSGRRAVDDVLEAGDPDFFRDPEVEKAYFDAVSAIREPGRSAREAEKVLTLYTARPIKDRADYERVREIPSNVFLTTSFDEAEGYAVDFGKRDVWALRIKKKYLVSTLDTPRVQNYQTYSHSGKVPVERTELVAKGEEHGASKMPLDEAVASFRLYAGLNDPTELLEKVVSHTRARAYSALRDAFEGEMARATRKGTPKAILDALRAIGYAGADAGLTPDEIGIWIQQRDPKANYQVAVKAAQGVVGVVGSPKPPPRKLPRTVSDYIRDFFSA